MVAPNFLLEYGRIVVVVFGVAAAGIAVTILILLRRWK
jgi:hypothetical protein